MLPRIIQVVCVAVCALGLCGLAGCDNDGFNHTPPDGQGTLVVDNKTSDHLNVYVDGRSVFQASPYDHELVDLNPGVYRIVVDQRNGYHSYRADLDILAGQLTVVEVKGYYSVDSYDARVYFE
jgi:hypothetical protein